MFAEGILPMGREADCSCRWAGGVAKIRALLETRELILRGELRRRFATADLRDIRARSGELCFSAGGEDYALRLGAPEALVWSKKLTTPPPSLAAKLGVSAASKVKVIGLLEDAVLRDALAGCLAVNGSDAALNLAVVHDAETLQKVLHTHAAASSATAIWIVHEKGPRAAFGEMPVRRAMRTAGYMDNKVASVSDNLTATRYKRR